MPEAASTWAMLATRLWWVSITPLDRPVVPDEYGSTTTSSSGSTATGAASGSPNSSSAEAAPPVASPSTKMPPTPVPSAPSVATSRNIGMVTSSDAPASVSWWCTSGAV